MLVFDALGSTNDDAMARGRAGDPGRLWVVAREQSSGRGRLGRPWSSPRGNLHASLLLIDPCAPRHGAQLGFVAGVAALRALRSAAPGAPVGLKWPNDILCAGAKLAGVLVEGGTAPGGGFACVVGFGVDCAESPGGVAYPVTHLQAQGFGCGPEEVFRALSDAMCETLALWRGGAGFSTIRSAWLEGAVGLGRPLEARTPKGVLRGVFETIDDEGRLILATAGGRAVIEAGDVFPTLASSQTCAPTQDIR